MSATKKAPKAKDSNVSVLDRIETRIGEIRGGTHVVQPGSPLSFSAASVPGDILAQGDLYICVIENSAIPKDYEEISYKPVDLQLVPDNTEGARHCLKSFDGVKVYRPKNWTGEDLRGPILVTSQDKEIMHRNESKGGHGTIELPAGFTFACFYQPEWSEEEKKERRARD